MNLVPTLKMLGEGRVSPWVGLAVVRTSNSMKEDGVALKVWNPSPVIPHGELARLFEPFYRRNEQEETTRGWGLGLAFVKRIAEQHGGRVDAFNETSQGLRFISHLSVAPLVLSAVHP